MKRQEFINIIKLSEQPFTNDHSHIYGSDYYTVNGYHIRISDHSKNENSRGFERFRNGNDFRNYQDALDYLSQFLDMTDKTQARKEFYELNANRISQTEEGYFKNPYGIFATMEQALNNWFKLTLRLKKQDRG